VGTGLFFASLLTLGGCAAAAPPARTATRVLPLRSVRLYETGVGYFERSGVAGSFSETSLPVPAGHLDDALKTLVVLSRDGKSSVKGLEFGSSMSASMARSLAGIPAEISGLSYEALLSSMRGASVEVKTARESVSGRLVDVVAAAPSKESKDAREAKDAKESRELTLLVLTDRAEMRRMSTENVVSIRPTDPVLAARIGKALDALSPRVAQARQTLRIAADSATPVTLGYVAEAPVWRTTYRLVLDPEQGGVLQGWALLHNDTDEDWQSVNVELVNGRPDSFLFPFATPRYERRVLVHPDRELSTVPQLADKSADQLWGDEIHDSFGAGGIGLTGVGEGGGGRGEGIGLGSIGTIGHGSGGDTASSLLSIGNLAASSQATGTESGALFLYRLARPLDLQAHGSALVPFVQQRVDAKALCWFDRSGDAGRAGVRVVNGTGQTLPAGTIAVFADGGFAGESALDRLKPGERRFLRYGVDLDVELRERGSKSSEKSAKLVFERDTLVEHYVRHTDLVYEIENRSGRDRAVYVRLALANNATVKGSDENDYDQATAAPLAVFDVKARSTATRQLVADEGLARTVALAALRSDVLHRLGAEDGLPDAQRKIALEAEAKQKAVEEARAKLEKAGAVLKGVEQDIARLRDTLKAMGDKGAGAGPNPVLSRIVALEDNIVAQRKVVEAMTEEVRTRTDAVRAVLAKLRA
jgi:hypothetical protein